MSESTLPAGPASLPSPQPVGDLDTTYGSGSAAGPDQDVETDTVLDPPAGQP